MYSHMSVSHLISMIHIVFVFRVANGSIENVCRHVGVITMESRFGGLA